MTKKDEHIRWKIFFSCYICQCCNKINVSLYKYM